MEEVVRSSSRPAFFYKSASSPTPDSMRFGIIYYGTQVKNRGLDQLAQCLCELGHQPFIVARRPKSCSTTTKFNNTRVIQVPWNTARLGYIASTPVPFNLIWEKWIIALSKKHEWDGIFVRETPLSLQALRAAKKLRISAFLDMRENLGAMYLAGSRTNLLRRVLRHRSLVHMYESFVVPHYNHVFTVSDELGSWVARHYKIASRQLSTLGNYPSKTFLKQSKEAIKRRNKGYSNHVIRMVHTGYVGENHGLQDIIRAVRILMDKGDNRLILRIIGNGSYLTKLKRLVRQLRIQERVEFWAMLEPENVAEALADCDIGVCAYFLNEQTHQTLPGKLFEYMAVGLPVVSSARKPVVRIIEKEQCGVIYHSRDPETIAQAIDSMCTDSLLLGEMADRGRKAILRSYNQKKNLGVLAEVLEQRKMN